MEKHEEALLIWWWQETVVPCLRPIGSAQLEAVTLKPKKYKKGGPVETRDALKFCEVIEALIYNVLDGQSQDSLKALFPEL